MEASAEMKWGLICSVEDQENMQEFVDFSIWMIKQLENSASKLKLGHKFVESPTFVLHAVPGSLEQSRECYETIANKHPQVLYVIHILPSKDSMEYQVLKEHTLAGALVGQGVLAENALAYFKCYELEEVMANMNQWIGRRLAQITARRTDEKENKKGEEEGEKVENEESNNNLVQNNADFKLDPKWNCWEGICLKTLDENVDLLKEVMEREKNFNNKQKYRKDNYRLTVATGGNAVNQQNSSPRRFCRSPHNCDNNFEHPVGVVFNSSSNPGNRGVSITQQQNTKPFNWRNNFNQVGVDRECDVIVKGYPSNFNKFQIASLFFDFRPLNVQYMEGSEALVQFANKFQAIQVIQLYNERKYEDEGFTLKVRTATTNEDLTKQLGTVKTKLASLLLKSTTTKAVGKENLEVTTSDEDKKVW